MKKTLLAILLVLSLVMSLAFVACEGEKESETGEEIQVNSSEKETSAETPEQEENDVLGVGADTDDSWGPIQRN